ncbi:hypothetical protein [Streptosporangium sp. H16]|uniref:hypothetical protein n=1 Tax=Streptosporangium sp. H16 TaxID=3444184 RepID=UPI003F7B297D
MSLDPWRLVADLVRDSMQAALREHADELFAKVEGQLYASGFVLRKKVKPAPPESPRPVIRRYTEPGRARTLVAVVPCCDRRVSLDRDTTPLVVCLPCRRAYDVALTQEEDSGYATGDGGFIAAFTARDDLPVAARLRSKRPAA